MKPSTITTIDLLRHGDVEGDMVYRGITNDPVTNAGWQQMVEAIKNHKDWNIIISSPLQSCREFAQVIAKEEDIDLEFDKQLQEIDYGLWEGLSPEDIMQEDADLLHAWCRSPTKITPPEGEDYHDFKARILKSLKQTIAENQGQKILLITHAGIIRVILMDILGMPDDRLFSLDVKHGSLSRIQINHDDSGQWGCLIEHC